MYVFNVLELCEEFSNSLADADIETVISEIEHHKDLVKIEEYYFLSKTETICVKDITFTSNKTFNDYLDVIGQDALITLESDGHFGTGEIEVEVSSAISLMQQGLHDNTPDKNGIGLTDRIFSSNDAETEIDNIIQEYIALVVEIAVEEFNERANIIMNKVKTHSLEWK